MKGNPEVLASLKAAMAAEAHLNLQYRLDARSLRFIGVKKTAKHINKFGDDAHDFLKCVTDRTLFLAGDPSYGIAPVVEQKTVTALLQNELALEAAIVAPYETAVQTAQKALDDTTRNLFEHLLKWHEQNMLWLQTQVNLIANIGEGEYIAEKL